MEIVLASASPRRRELMARVTPDFRIFPTDVDEASLKEPDPLKFAVAAAVLKAQRASETFPEAVVIGADTVVALGPRLLGKPADRETAREMLMSLSGKRHRVITGLALFRRSDGRLLTGHELTWVTFRPLTPAMIEAYLDQGTFLDKAGAYAVQEIGDAFVARMKGDYDNVVGFPVRKVRTLLDRFLTPPLALTVENMAFPAAHGLASIEGRTYIVPGGVRGDRVLAQVIGERSGAGVVEILGLEAASAERADPRCPHFGRCGGCLFQHVSYATQLELKGRYLRRTFERAGLVEAAVAVGHVAASPEVYGYRNKMEFAFGDSGDGLVLGLRERTTTRRRTVRRTLPLRECPIFSPVVERVFPAVLAFARDRRLEPFDLMTGRGTLRHLVLRQAKRTGELMAVLATAGLSDETAAELAGRLAEAAPELASFVHSVSRRTADVVEYRDLRLLLGRPYIEERVGGLTFRVRPQTFFQTNTAGAELLYVRLRELAPLTPGSRVLGLYCGSGPIELSLASAAGRVTGIDSSPADIAAAVENALLNGVANVEFRPGTVESLLGDLRRQRVDVVVLDPPRAGLTDKALRLVIALGAPAVIYVSCQPESLARDLRVLRQAGYRIGPLAAFDLFPHTPHLETVVVLSRL